MQNATYTPRMEGLDALRGFALFGIFIVHMPELFELYWAHPATDPLQLAVHDAVWLVFAARNIYLMFFLKMLPFLLTMLLFPFCMDGPPWRFAAWATPRADGWRAGWAAGR